MTETSMKYRRDIDGLRAVAVLAVVLHHLSSSSVPGGYVGVDVFFVISGYLITKIIHREMASGTFTFTRFYERRVRRIFPALFAVLAAVLIAGYFLLLPTDYLATLRGALGTVLFSANIVFWRDLLEGYFAADAKLNPLLHMWSLGVEEQFYLMFPLLLLLIAKVAKERLFPVLAVVAGVSLLAAAVLLPSRSVAVFFLLPFRAWELLIGSMLAVAVVPQLRGHWLREGVAVLGLLAIVVPIFAYDTGTAFPGIAAVPVVLGTALLIHVGGGSTTLVGKLLQWRPVVYLGLISYSLYLWHWPLIVFTRFWTGLEPLRPWIPALFVASILVASASYHFIEQPFRSLGKEYGHRVPLQLGAALAIALTAICFFGIQSRGIESRFEPGVVAFDQVRIERSIYKNCEAKIMGEGEHLCVIGAPGVKPDVLLWGDSHMLAWAPAMEAALRKTGRSAFLAPNSACPPLLNLENLSDPACRDQNLAVFAALEAKPNIRTVVIAGFWAKYFSDSNIALAKEDGITTGNVQLSPPALRRTVASLVASGRSVIVLGPVPTYPTDVALALAQQGINGRDLSKALTLDDVHRSNASFYKTVGTGLPASALLVDVAAWLCSPDCAISRDGVAIYRDSNHLSQRGAILLVPHIVQMLESQEPLDKSAVDESPARSLRASQ
ncbi:acyltransferase [Pseudoxanthomonas gei]|uniref:Acyltransferase n=1 Tax=Pseudoxanthomonas gei TaxID=1383030 RepID=A0ABX0AHM4_9GAMM|nr:acyltransferase family protein [Pseudoxanthomonas gei]NDK38723.1 acyltransferase [Pseudoxanthomonas gei]